MGASMALLFISYCDVMIVYFECFVIQVLLVNIDNNLKLVWNTFQENTSGSSAVFSNIIPNKCQSFSGLSKMTKTTYKALHLWTLSRVSRSAVGKFEVSTYW